MLVKNGNVQFDIGMYPSKYFVRNVQKKYFISINYNKKRKVFIEHPSFNTTAQIG